MAKQIKDLTKVLAVAILVLSITLILAITVSYWLMVAMIEMEIG